MLPRAVIHFTWSEGKTNPADLSTKLLLDPISQINSELFRIGPNLYQSKTEVLKNTYLRMSKSKGIEWFGLDDAVTKTKKNVAMLKELMIKRKDDALANQASIEQQKKIDEPNSQEKQVEYIEKAMQSKQEDFVCNTCWEKNVDPEFCGVFLVTRSRALIGKKN